MTHNTLFQSITDKLPLTEDAKMLHGTLDMATSLIVARLIQERIIDYAGQPGETIEYLSQLIAAAFIDSLARADTVELIRFINSRSTVGQYIYHCKE